MSRPAPRPPLPVYQGPYCESEDSSLKNTLVPADSLNLRLLCAINGKDLLQRFVKTQQFDRDLILDDHKNRIGDDFTIPDSIRHRVGFWFDIYTKYPSYIRIVHHSRYPWIKFREFDMTDFLVSPQIEWMRIQKAEKFISSETQKLKAQLLRMSKIKDISKFNDEQKFLSELLAEIPGPRAKVYADAAESMRIQTGQMDFFVEAIMRKSQYIDEMEKIFISMNVPPELTRLPLVESSFNPHAVSKAGAMGIWQFMPGTGRSIMKVNDSIDERRSPMKSTVGAAKYLRGNARYLHNSWALSVLAYNHGPGGVSKALKKRGTRDITVLINSYSGGAFGFASANYYPEFLAALYAEKYQKDVFGKLKALPKIEFEKVTITQAITPHDLARTLALPVEVILGYNLDLKIVVSKNQPLPVGYVLHVPKGFGSVLTAYMDEQTKQQLKKPKARKVSESQTKSKSPRI
jgi:membrane-bound lytic murein transglycosylase D